MTSPMLSEQKTDQPQAREDFRDDRRPSEVGGADRSRDSAGGSRASADGSRDSADGSAKRQARVAADFGKAAGAYDSAARLQRQVGERLLEKMAPGQGGAVMDLGCGTGYFLPALARRLAPATLTAVDLSPQMLDYAREHRPVEASFIAASAESVPLPESSQRRIFSSLMVQWCQDLPAVAAEIHRLLAPGGEALLSTLVEGTLGELREAWHEADPGVAHVNDFLAPGELERQLRRVFPDARLDYECIRLWYPQPMALLKELKTLGARHKDNGRRSATSPGRLRALNRAYSRWRDPGQGVPASYQVAYIRLHKPL